MAIALLSPSTFYPALLWPPHLLHDISGARARWFPCATMGCWTLPPQSDEPSMQLHKLRACRNSARVSREVTMSIKRNGKMRTKLIRSRGCHNTRHKCRDRGGKKVRGSVKGSLLDKNNEQLTITESPLKHVLDDEMRHLYLRTRKQVKTAACFLIFLYRPRLYSYLELDQKSISPKTCPSNSRSAGSGRSGNGWD